MNGGQGLSDSDYAESSVDSEGEKGRRPRYRKKSILQGRFIKRIKRGHWYRMPFSWFTDVVGEMIKREEFRGKMISEMVETGIYTLWKRMHKKTELVPLWWEAWRNFQKHGEKIPRKYLSLMPFRFQEDYRYKMK